MGVGYLRYSFTKGTNQEIDFLESVMSLRSGCKLLDVGCGPGRHSLELARRGYQVTGLDISDRFVEIATESARKDRLDVEFARFDARDLPGRFVEQFDCVICLCQGGFGLMLEPEEDLAVFEGLVRCLRPGGNLALSAFNAYFVNRHFSAAKFDASRGVSEEETEVRDEDGNPLGTRLWTGCYTPRELRLMADRSGLVKAQIFGVEPGSYRNVAPSVDLPEFLLIAERSSGGH